MANQIETDLIIEAISKGFDKVSKDIRGLGASSETAEKQVSKASKGIGAMDVALGNLASGALQMAGRAMVDFAKESVNVAMNMEETASLIDNSLGPAADSFRVKIEAMADATNRSAIELEAGASTIIAMTRSMGLGQQAAADYSATMAQIATDLGSFFNKSTEDVFLDIQSALAGSSETLQKYGIDVRETALKQAALNMGLSDGKEVLDRVTRATVIQAEILRQASDAMGDAERTSDSASNTMRGLEAATLDLQAAIGQELIPVMYELTIAASGAIKALSATTSAKQAREELLSLGSQYKDLQKAISNTAAQMLKDNTIWEARRFEAQLLTEVLKLLDAGVEGTTEELIGYAQAAIAANTRAAAMNRTFEDQVVVTEEVAEAIEEVTRLTAAQSRAIVNAHQQNQTYEVSVEQVEEAEKKRQDALQRSIDLLAEIAQIAADSAQKQTDAAGEIFDAYDDLADAQGEYVTVYKDNSDEIAEIQSQLMGDLGDEQKDGLSDQLDELDEYSAEAIGIWNQLQGDLTESQRRELIAQLADLQGTHGEMQSVYTGDIEAAEEAQERITAAMGAIAAEYQNMVLAMTEARLSALFAEDGEVTSEELATIQLAMISLKEEMGLISSAAADVQRELVLNAETAGQSLDEMLDGFLADGVLSRDEMEQLATKSEEFSDRAAEAFERQARILSGETAEAAASAVTNYGEIATSVLDVKLGIDGVIESTEALDGMSVNIDVSAALAKLNELQNSADVLAAKLAGAGGPTAEPTAGNGSTGGTPYDPGAGGGGNLPGPGGQHGLNFMVPPGFPNDTFPLRASSGERVIIQTPGQQAAGNGGGLVIESIIVQALPGMDTEQLAEAMIRKLGGATRGRLNSRAIGSRL